MINQLRYVTKKLQGQTLNEASEGSSSGKVGSEERDSGTESDDEQPYEEPEPGMWWCLSTVKVIPCNHHSLQQ